MADIPAGLLSDLDIALNEAEWHNARVRTDIAEAMLDFRVLTLPESGSEPDHNGRVVRLRLTQVGRVIASLRHGRWDDLTADVEQFSLEALNDVVNSFGAQPIYGWHFFDTPAAGSEEWSNRLSLDVRIDSGRSVHALYLFQESLVSPRRHLDFEIWFNGIAAYDFATNPIPLLDVAAGGIRWWDAFNARDPRTDGHGMVLGRPTGESDEHD